MFVPLIPSSAKIPANAHSLFFLINSYTTGISSTVLENILRLNIKKKGTFSHGEVGLPMSDSKLILPCGIYGKWES